MAEAETKDVEVADYYQCKAGLTVGVHVCSEDEVIEGSAMGFNETNPPLSEEEQQVAYGQVMYREYEPEDEEVEPIARESRTIRAMMGMQSPDMPPVSPTPDAEAPLDTLSRQDLRKKAKALGLNFPEDTDRDQMIGAIRKKQDESEGEDEDEPEVVSKRRAAAKEAIEKNNELATGGSGGGGGNAGGGSRGSSGAHRRQQPQPRDEEEEEEK
jgi:hypothetical protein